MSNVIMTEMRRASAGMTFNQLVEKLGISKYNMAMILRELIASGAVCAVAKAGQANVYYKACV